MRALFLTAACLFCLIWQSEQQKCHTSEVDLCMFPSLLLARRNLVPTDEEALNSSCRVWTKEQDCLRNYARNCFTDIHRMFFNLVFGENMQLVKELCEHGSRMHNDFLKASPCLLEAANLTLETCAGDIENVIYIMTSGNTTEATYAGCCFFERFFKCYSNLFVSKCNDHLDMQERANKLLLLDTIHNICSSYDHESEMCINVLSQRITTPSEEGSYLARLLKLFLRH